jgi:hypothetical protein
LDFLKKCKRSKIKYVVKRRKIKWWIFEEGENQKMQMVEER